MYKIFLVVYYALYLRLTSGQQWVPAWPTEPGQSDYSPQPLPSELIYDTKPSDTTNNIPIIVLLKPRQAKQLDLDNVGAGGIMSTPGVQSLPLETDDNPQPTLSMVDWLSGHMDNSMLPAIDNGYNKMYLTQQQVQSDSMDEPSAESSDQTTDVVPVIRGRAPTEKVQWPLSKSGQLSPDKLAQIKRMWPKFAALTEANGGSGNGQPDLAQLAKSSGIGSAAFEEALKKFAGNLTDLGHRSAQQLPKQAPDGYSTESTGADDNEDNGTEDETNSSDSESNETTNDSSKTGLDATSDNSNNKNDANGNKMSEVEQRDNSDQAHSLKAHQKAWTQKQLANNKAYEIKKGFQPIGKPELNGKGWSPIKGKTAKRKHQGKPHHSKYGPYEGLTMDYTTSNMGVPVAPEPTVFGMPTPYPSMHDADSMVSFGHPPPPPRWPGMRRPFHKNYISLFGPPRPYHRPHMPFHATGYSAYLNDPDISSTILQAAMEADTLKPTHAEPQKASDGKGGADKKDGADGKSSGEVKGMGGEGGIIGGGVDEIMRSHGVSCCDILNGGQHMYGSYGGQFGGNLKFGGQQFGHNQVIHEEVIHIPAHDMTDSVPGVTHIGAMDGISGGDINKDNKPVTIGGAGGIGGGGGEHGCHNGLGGGQHYPFHPWSYHHRPRPQYRPKLFYKPLLFG